MSELVKETASDSTIVVGTSEIQLSELIRAVIKEQSRFPDFVEALATRGVEFVCHLTQNGRVTAVSFISKELGQVKASSLGSEFTWTGLQRKLGLEYVKIRDFQALAACAKPADKQASSKSKNNAIGENELLSGLERIERLEQQILDVINEQQAVDYNRYHDELQAVATDARSELQRVDDAVRKIEGLAESLNRAGQNAVIPQTGASNQGAMQNLEEELRYNLGQIKGICQNALAESNRSVQRAEHAVVKIRQESFWLAIVAALVAGLVSALVTGLWLTQENQKGLEAQQQALIQHMDENAQNDPLRIYFQKLMDNLP